MPPAGLSQIQELFQRILNLAVGAAFIVLTVMLIYAGIRFLTSGGDPKALSSASSILTWSLLGILFLALAWIILRLLEAITGVPLTTFCLGFKPFCP